MAKESADGEFPLEFGHAMLKHFKLAEGFKNLNHGSFGLAPRSVLQKQREYLDMMEEKPDIWCRYLYVPIVNEVRKQISPFLNLNNNNDTDGLVLVENASTGVNSVMRSMQWEQEDTIIYLSTAYPMVVNTAHYLQHTFKINLHKIEIIFPTTLDAIYEIVEREIEKLKKEGKRIKMGIFSHITSVPSIVLPIQKIISLCRQNNILSLIDGAHAPGQIPVDLSLLQPDFYTGNLHKWFYAPKGTAFLWVREEHRKYIVPTIISSEYSESASFAFKFQYTGTKDYAQFCAVTESVKFVTKVGAERIMDYLHKLAVDGGILLSSMWNTEVLHSDESMVAGMVNVRLPTSNASIIAPLSKMMQEKYNTFIVFFPFQGGVWTRFSAAIYLDISDVKWMGEIVLAGISELEKDLPKN